MKTQRKPVETVADVGQLLENLQQFKAAIDDQIDDLARRYPAAETEPMPVSHRMILATCKRTLRKLRHLDMAPHVRAEFNGTYALVCAELGVDE
jgi:predicted component of type VI protein secretion system